MIYDENFNSQPESTFASSRENDEADRAPGGGSEPSHAVRLNCPYCNKKFSRDQTSSMPFCSSRCKQIDLGMWLNENHGVPYENDREIYVDHDFDALD